MRHILILWLCFLSFSAQAQGRQAAIASAHPLATQAGMEILEQGGNAFDAAIAVTAALAVVEPAGSGLGGGGFWLLHRARDAHQIMIDGREMAPGKAHADMYLDQKGQFNPKSSLNGPLAAGIPGVPAAIDYLSRHYGQLPLSTVLQPAIRYAREGFAISEGYRRLAGFRHEVMQSYPATAAIFLDEGEVPALGYRLQQPDLADTLEAIAEQGKAGFYQGETATKLVQSVQDNGGIWTLEDLANYRVKTRKPVKAVYHDYQITSASLPSSGGIVLTLALNILEHFDLQGADKLQQQHWVIEAMRRAYRDRSRHLGDSDFVAVPRLLTTKAYARQQAKTIDNHRAGVSEPVKPAKSGGENTTHFSIVDQHGNRVAATLSINYPFGSGFVAEGTGVLLNDEMDDFSAKTGTANAYGLVGTEANAIAPYKRPLSSMSPSFIENPNKLMITGTPGGSRIISMVLLSLLDFVEGKNAEQIVSAPRYHHQYLPDQVQIEKEGFSEETISALTQRGHKVKTLSRQYGDMQIITVNLATGELDAASDPRGEGLAEVKTIRP
ncbi:gamma-glutamyltransferase [uncultured Methylophaga sp.]|uniref:gamma-glutamyltransferase n=1 Tax=uncultured Methylophaga sp. TaxID=285271 RepID=UPI0026040B58|nr:gamma-glutamyltransferase [uncultured Methylophaga sp.]